ncbi:hypothetical protein [Xanthomonas campestris]|uniref:hypothetical protein n=1 Tax=Xanthomonas campestris TaxID=339 RepID=UPI0011AF9EA4|nr:hypothetical protein [Xanthomonas campestris]MCD0262728.1 hypothetical protein [Xanthomonas campestris pv. campestris]MCD0271537.1 hypothetical protein [Xanthomonas campestris pv. campestris]MCD0276534.1 hypothetical protein [Xanthomonas campestris pv. campestris]MCF8787791.1 hypothetical protein [Xanthomonas campestris pv. campestris]MCF8799887.1 hypothetical protein [Xanthomonas campestris pv. campestris]
MNKSSSKLLIKSVLAVSVFSGFFVTSAQAVPFSVTYNGEASGPRYETARIDAIGYARMRAYFDGWLGANTPQVADKLCPLTNLIWYQPNGSAGGYVVIAAITCTKQIPG